VGSSTACLASIQSEDGLVKTTNLGDSGYVKFRRDSDALTKVLRLKEQQYRFNFPYQCGTGCELLTAAFDTEYRLQEKDFIVMGTDGLFDNVFDDDMKPCLIKENIEQPEKTATCIGEFASTKSKNKRYESPFAFGAKQAGKWYKGGKADDITVIVAEVVKQS